MWKSPRKVELGTRRNGEFRFIYSRVEKNQFIIKLNIMNKKGFTLIELLVVIAIIGILSSIAIVYLSDARNKANDAKITSNVTTASTQTELQRANDGDLSVDDAYITSVINKLGQHPCAGTWESNPAVGGGASYSSLAYYSNLCTDNTVIWCADSNGFRGTTTAAAMTAAGAGRCQ